MIMPCLPRLFIPAVTTALGFLIASSSFADDTLMSLYRQALNNDADFAAARAAYEAEAESRSIGRAGLLPSVSLGASKTRDHLSRQEISGTQTEYHRNARYEPTTVTLRLSQPLFDLARWAAYKEGDARSARAEVVYTDARQELALRVSQAYFNYLLAADNLELARAQKKALAVQQTQAEGLFKAGSATRTDVEETRARHQLAQAQELSAHSAVELRRKDLGKITGKQPPATPSALIVAPKLMPPEPASIDTWVDAACSRNLKVLAQQAALQIASYQIDKTKASFLPSVSLVASRQHGRDTSYYIDRDDNSQIGIQLNMNIFEGGGNSAQHRQASALKEKTRHELASLTKEAETKASQAFLEILNGIAQIQALEQAVKSAEIALQGMEAGQKSGLRTNSDVLNAQQQLFSARRDLQKERYGYLINRLNLLATVGGLDDTEVESIDRMVDSMSAH